MTKNKMSALKRGAGVLALAVGMMTAMPGLAQEEASGLEAQLAAQDARIDALEGKIDRLVEVLLASPLLQEVPEVDDGQAAQAATLPAAEAPEMKPGWFLDVYLIERKRDKEPPKAPTGVSIGRTVDLNAPVLKRDAVKVDPALKSAGEGRNHEMGLYWNGVIEIAESGPHIFFVALQNKNRFNEDCRATLVINGDTVADTEWLGRDGNVSGQAQVSLTAGVHEIGVWQPCSNTYYKDSAAWDIYKDLQVVVAMRGPRDNTLTPIPQSIIGYYE
mgnify:CR=1 FL=1